VTRGEIAGHSVGLKNEGFVVDSQISVVGKW